MSARRRVVLALLAASGAFALGGCLLVSDFTGLTGGQAQADAAAIEASTDGPVLSDAALEASVFTCEGALLCDRFDDGDFTPPWSRSYTSSGGTVTLDPLASAPSAPRVLTASIGRANGFAYLGRDFLPAPAPARGAKLAFSVLPERLDPSGLVVIAAFVFGEGTGREHNLRLRLRASVLEIEESVGNAPSRKLPLPRPLPIGTWSRVAIAVLADRTSVEVDGTEAIGAAALAPWGESDALRIVLGINFSIEATGDGFAFRFDDARFDTF